MIDSPWEFPLSDFQIQFSSDAPYTRRIFWRTQPCAGATKKEKLPGVCEPIIERHPGNTREALWTIGLAFPTESTSPWTFPRWKQRGNEPEGNMKGTPDRAAIFHNSWVRRYWKESSGVSFLSGPWNFLALSLSFVPFASVYRPF